MRPVITSSRKKKRMVASGDHHSYARGIIEPIVKEEGAKREKITLPDEETITEGLVDTLEEIYDEMDMGE